MIAMRNYLLNKGYTEAGLTYICMLIQFFLQFLMELYGTLSSHYGYS